MKFSAQTKDFKSALALAMACCPGKSTIPILSHVLITADSGGLAITASDLDREVKIACAAAVQEPGTEAIDGGMLSSIIAQMRPDAEIAIQSEASKVKLVSGRSRFSIPTLPPADFPSLGEPSDAAEYILTGGAFQAAAMRVLFAVSTDTVTKSYLCGIHIHPDDNSWVFVGADKAWLAVTRFDAPQEGHSLTPFTLPPKTATLMAKLFPGNEGLTMHISEQLMAITGPSASIVSKLMESNYPDYTRVIPGAGLQTIRIDRGDFAALIGRVAAVGAEAGVDIAFDGEVLRATCYKSMGADSADEMSLVDGGDPFSFKINAQCVTATLAMFSEDEISIGFEKDRTGASAPMVFRGDETGVLAVVMSMTR